MNGTILSITKILPEGRGAIASLCALLPIIQPDQPTRSDVQIAISEKLREKIIIKMNTEEQQKT
jgi:hypothetical protein